MGRFAPGCGCCAAPCVGCSGAVAATADITIALVTGLGCACPAFNTTYGGIVRTTACGSGSHLFPGNSCVTGSVNVNWAFGTVGLNTVLDVRLNYSRSDMSGVTDIMWRAVLGASPQSCLGLGPLVLPFLLDLSGSFHLCDFTLSTATIVVP